MITSLSNEKIKHVTMLVKNTKARRTEGVFVVEGERIASEIPKDRMVECYVSESYTKDNRLDGIFPYRVEPTVVSDTVFKKMSDTQNPQGIMCVCRQTGQTLNDFCEAHKEGRLRVLVLEKIQDPGNLGTMIRTAEGAGFDAVVADCDTVDVYNPKVTRSTMGSLFRVPVIYTDDAKTAVDVLKDHDVTVYAAHLNGNTDHKEEKYGERLAFLIGNEGNGLSEELTQKADRLVRIPMKGKLESLNAAVAAAILMYSVD